MKKISDLESRVTPHLPETSSSDDIIVYATLVVSELPKPSLQRISEVFHLSLNDLPSGFYLKAMYVKPGAHKLQTLDLLAAAICIYQKFPNARASLNVGHDFMIERRNKERELKSELEFLPPGHLQISPACQLFLVQTGFDLEAQQNSRMLAAREVVSLAENFHRQHKMKQGA